MPQWTFLSFVFQPFLTLYRLFLHISPDAHHQAVSTLSSKLNSAIESRRNAEAKAEAHLIEATRLAEEVAAVREELIKAKKDLVRRSQSQNSFTFIMSQIEGEL